MTDRELLAKQLGFEPITNISREQHAYQNLETKEWLTNETLDELVSMFVRQNKKARIDELEDVTSGGSIIKQGKLMSIEGRINELKATLTQEKEQP